MPHKPSERCPICDRKLKPKVHFVDLEDTSGVKHRTKQTIVKCRCGLSSNLIQGLP